MNLLKRILKQNPLSRFEKLITKDCVIGDLRITWDKLKYQRDENQKALEEIDALNSKLLEMEALLEERNYSYDNMMLSLEELLEELT